MTNLWQYIQRLEQLQDSNKRMSGISFLDEVGQFVEGLDGMIQGLRDAQIEIEAAEKQLEWNYRLNEDIEEEAIA